MGFFQRIFCAKKSGDSQETKESRQKKWSFSNISTKNKKHPNNGRRSSGHGTGGTACQYDDNLDSNKHAIAVAAATAAVADAALAAAKAAAEVVRLTSGTAGASSQLAWNQRMLDEFSCVRIQSAFRGYLARRALRALKALVKLQALVRGHIVRKQTADMLRRMQTMVRLQAQARAGRANSSDSLQSGSKSSLPRDPRSCSNTNLGDFIDLDEVQSGWFNNWVEENILNQKNTISSNVLADEEKFDKILEVDTWKPRLNFRNSTNTCNASYSSDYSNVSCVPFDSPSRSSRKCPNPNPSISSGEVLCSSSVKYRVGKEAYDSPQASSSSRPGSSARRGAFTPARSECSWGYFSGYSSYPNYMANTESSRAKVRSHSAPRQRVEFEKYGTTRRSVQRSWDADTGSEKGFYLHSDVRKKAYPALNRLGSSKLK